MLLRVFLNGVEVNCAKEPKTVAQEGMEYAYRYHAPSVKMVPKYNKRHGKPRRITIDEYLMSKVVSDKEAVLVKYQETI